MTDYDQAATDAFYAAVYRATSDGIYSVITLETSIAMAIMTDDKTDAEIFAETMTEIRIATLAATAIATDVAIRVATREVLKS
jgi:hypothetical protein